MADITDLIHRLRLAVQSYTPGISTLSKAEAAMNPWGAMIGAATQGDVLNNHTPTMVPSAAPQSTPQDAAAQSSALGIPPSAVVSPQAPTGPAEAGFPYQPSTPAEAGFPYKPSVPMPQPRPAQAAQPSPPQMVAPGLNSNGSIFGAQGQTSVNGAPLQPQMSFFQRNAAMMKDPQTGQYLDPNAAAQAQASMPSFGSQFGMPSLNQNGSSLINKMLNYLHNGVGGSVGNNNDPSTMGSA